VWRKREALARTLARRPDLLEAAELDDDERRWLDEWGWSGDSGRLLGPARASRRRVEEKER
jgi:hypothetical protein